MDGYREVPIENYQLSKKVLGRLIVDIKGRQGIAINPLSSNNNMLVNKYGRYTNDRYTLLYRIMRKDPTYRVEDLSLKKLFYKNGKLYLPMNDKVVSVKFYNREVELFIVDYAHLLSEEELCILLAVLYISQSNFMCDDEKGYTYPLMIVDSTTSLQYIKHNNKDIIYGYSKKTTNITSKELVECELIGELRECGDNILCQRKNAKISFPILSLLLSSMATYTHILNNREISNDVVSALSSIFKTVYPIPTHGNAVHRLVEEIFKYINKYREVVNRYDEIYK